jgi:hypothetical protein
VVVVEMAELPDQLGRDDGAIMLPSAAPTILLFAALTRTRASVSALPPTAGFAAGYVLLSMSVGREEADAPYSRSGGVTFAIHAA